jgi:hypothetical protein
MEFSRIWKGLFFPVCFGVVGGYFMEENRTQMIVTSLYSGRFEKDNRLLATVMLWFASCRQMRSRVG